MTIARGLFRLWVVASLAWAGAVGAVTWETLPQDYPENLTRADGWTPCSKGGPCTGKVWDDELAPSKEPFDPTRPYRMVSNPERPTAIKMAGLLALAPPVVVLLFGAALFWVARGFSPAQPPSS
jgi:hypothetical protein